MKATTLGKAISERRKELGLTQKQLAEMIKKEDGQSITPQFLNDIERDRRRPSPYIVQKIAGELKGSADEYHRLAGQLPTDIDPKRLTPERWKEAMKAFRGK